MDWLIWFHICSYSAAFLLMSVFAVTYLSRSQFMSHHAEAINRPWQALDANLQLLLLALIRLIGWGWLAIACAGAVMLQQLVALNMPLSMLVTLQFFCLLAITPVIAVSSQIKRSTNSSPPITATWWIVLLTWSGFAFGVLAKVYG